jgi:microsomal epoxide hydrolase
MLQRFRWEVRIRAALLPIGILALAVSLHGADPSLSKDGLRSGFVTTSDGVKLHYLETGSGPAILFVPGWTGAAEFWAPQMRHFAATHRVVALDPRSQGDSDKPAEGNYHERRGRDIREVIEQLRLAPAIVVAWSMAVPETLSMVNESGSGALRAVVFVDGRVSNETSPEALKEFHARMRSLLLDRKKAAREIVPTWFRKPHSNALYETMALASIKTPTNTAIALQTNALSFDYRPVLGNLPKDALLVYREGADNAAFAKTVRERLPSAQIEFMDGVGHALFLDDTERFNGIMDRFVKSLGAK